MILYIALHFSGRALNHVYMEIPKRCRVSLNSKLSTKLAAVTFLTLAKVCFGKK